MKKSTIAKAIKKSNLPKKVKKVLLKKYTKKKKKENTIFATSAPRYQSCGYGGCGRS